MLSAIFEDLEIQEGEQACDQPSERVHKERENALRLPGIAADNGFTINRIGEKPIHGVMPASAKYGHKVTPEGEECNTNIARIRIVVEIIFARLKQWMILGGMFNVQLDT